MLERTSIRLAAALALLPVACSSPSPQVSPEPGATRAPALTASASPAPAARPTASARAKATPEAAAAMLARAEKCLADSACTEDADALYRQADDAGAKDVSCLRFYYGIGITRDLARTRACLERQVDGKCGGSSPDLGRLYLAAMLIDAQGGPADAARAKALFTDCFHDAAVTGVLAEVAKRSQPDPKRAPLDFCNDIGGTTLSMGECRGVERDRADAERIRVEKLYFPKLDAAGKKLAASARDAWNQSVEKESAIFYDVYKGGTIRSNVTAGHENALQTYRAEAMAHLFAYKPNPGADPARAESDMEKAYVEACKGDAERKKVCAASRKAWTAYRDAEVALYVHVHGASLGEQDVARDVKTTVTRKYQAGLEELRAP